MNIYYKLVGIKTRRHYWGCSNFARWIQKNVGMIPKPTSATAAGWTKWKNTNTKTHPTWYWITEEGLNILQDIVYFPYDVWMNFYYWYRNTFITKTHVIPTDLKRGQWYDVDSRLVSGVFKLLVDYVEVEKGHRYKVTNERKSLSGREAGLKYLDWEISLTDSSPKQAEIAKEIKEIYLWITDIRPNRPDPSDESGWSEYCDKIENIFDDDSTETSDMLSKYNNIESSYYEEDTNMLIRIIKIRNDLWT